MHYEILFYDAETGEKDKRRVEAHSHTEAVTLVAKQMGIDRYKFKEQIFDVRRVPKNG